MTWRAATSVVGVPDKRQGTGGGRAVNPTPFGFVAVDAIRYRTPGRDRDTLSSLRILRDLDQQASQAVWNYQRLMNPGHDLVAYFKNADGSETPAGGNAQVLLDHWALECAGEYGGGLDQLHDVLALSLLTNGAVAAEVAPAANGNEVEDWYPVEPLQLTYKRVKVDGEFFADGSAKTVLTLGQLDLKGQWHPVPEEQVFYQPLDNDIDDPYGRPPMVSAISMIAAKAQVLNDVRVMAHNQGYPRIDVKVLWEEMVKRAPVELQASGSEVQLEEWAAKQLRAIATDYDALNIDDTFVHYDLMEIGLVPGGSAPGSNSFDFGTLEQVLTDQLNSAVKQLPIMTGQGTGANETHGSIQWNIQVLSVAALRRHVKRIIEKLANATLRIYGEAAFAKVEYTELRTTDRLYEAQAERLEGMSLEQDVRMGWRDNDEAAEERTGHDAVEGIEPILLGVAPGGFVGTATQAGIPGQPTGENNPGGEQASNVASKSPSWSAAWDAETLGLNAMPASRAPAPPQGEPIVKDEQVARFRRAAGVLFIRLKEDVVSTLQDNGYLQPRDVPTEIGKHTFGLGYRREMKGLLRDAIRKGQALAGMVDDVSNFERIVAHIWNDNKPFIDKIASDLAAAIRAGEFTEIGDVDTWFRENAYRSDMMGEFLGKQGLNAGYSYAAEILRAVKFEWSLGGAEHHCPDCLGRDGTWYSAQELDSIGYPGSTGTQCMSACQCYLVEVSGEGG